GVGRAEEAEDARLDPGPARGAQGLREPRPAPGRFAGARRAALGGPAGAAGRPPRGLHADGPALRRGDRMSVSSGRYQLSFAFKALAEQWEETRAKWRDVVRDEFARDHWLPLATRVPEVLTALDSLEQVLARIRQDCGEEGEAIV